MSNAFESLYSHEIRTKRIGKCSIWPLLEKKSKVKCLCSALMATEQGGGGIVPSLMCDFVTGILMTYILTQLPTGSESLRLGVKFGTFHMSQSHGIFQSSFGFSLWCFSCLHLTIAGHEFFDIIYNTFIVMWYQREGAKHA